MLKLTMTLTGKTQRDIELALEEAKRYVDKGCTTAFDENDTGSFFYKIEGEEEEKTMEQTMTKLTDKATELGMQAANDGWMGFEVGDFENEELFDNDTCTLMQMNQEGWEQTDHYQIKYRIPMRELVEEAFDIESYDDAYIDKMNDMTTAFFEGFYDELNKEKDLTEMVEEERKTREPL